MKVYTDPRVFDLAGAVEKLPIPSSGKPIAAVATGTDGKTVSAGRTKRVTTSSAGNGYASARTGCGEKAAYRSQVDDNDRLSQRAAGIGADGQQHGENWGTRIRTYVFRVAVALVWRCNRC
jgi:hypothetical protein